MSVKVDVMNLVTLLEHLEGSLRKEVHLNVGYTCSGLQNCACMQIM